MSDLRTNLNPSTRDFVSESNKSILISSRMSRSFMNNFLADLWHIVLMMNFKDGPMPPPLDKTKWIKPPPKDIRILSE